MPKEELEGGEETEEEGEEETEEEGEEETEEEGEEETEEEEVEPLTVDDMQGWLAKLAKVGILKKEPKLPEDIDDAMARFEILIGKPPKGINPKTQVGDEKVKRKVYNDVVEFFNMEVDPELNPSTEGAVDNTPSEEEEAVEDAKKAPKAKAATGARGRQAAYTDNAKITVLKKDNPYRENSNRAARHQIVLGAKTYGEAVKAADKANLGPLGGVVRRAVEKKLIKIT